MLMAGTHIVPIIPILGLMVTIGGQIFEVVRLLRVYHEATREPMPI